ncbi:MAG: ribulose-phosphate 3-epimerase [Candidatus Micrarchaeia archaeon]
MASATRSGKVEVAPAILVKDRQSLLAAINTVKRFTPLIHIDIMDNKFVPNSTISVSELTSIPDGVGYEIHWMVENPAELIPRVSGRHLHIVHIEAVRDRWRAVEAAVKKAGGGLGLAFNPETPVEAVLPFIGRVERVLVMAVHPGFSGQRYIKEVEAKIAWLRKRFPRLDIEVDGGIDFATAASAVKAGANILASASTIFKSPEPGEAIARLKNAGRE